MFDKLKKNLSKLAKNKNVKSLAKKGLAFAKTDEGKELIKRGIKAAASGGATELNADNLEKLKKLKDKF
jgi:isopentenyl diphosphate isomerase/L-lactate dehydrogenase-like FMN-dependent dehydrogenase